MEQTDLLLRADQWLRHYSDWHDVPGFLTEVLVRDLVLALRQQEKDSTMNSQQPVDAPPFVDTPVLQAQRRAFDFPMQANLNALIEAVRAESAARADAAERALRPLQAERDKFDGLLQKIADVAAENLDRAETAEAEVRRGQAAQAALVARWRTTADALIEDVNNGHAPSHESDFARGMLSCADELAALIPPAPGTEPQ